MALGSISTLASLPILLLYCLNLFCVNAATYREFLRIGQSVGISDTIVSYGGNFELGFFSRIRENSTKYYVGIWFKFKKVPNDKIVWVANRNYSFQTSSAVLTIQPDGNLAIIDGPVTFHVSTVAYNYSTYVTLLDSGNLVLVNNSNQAVLWQSFDYPTDTLLPGMNLGTGWLLRSWTSADDPAQGAFSLDYDIGSVSLIVKKGSNVFWIDGRSNVSREGDVDRNRMGLRVMFGIDATSLFTLPAGSNSRLVLLVSGDLDYQDWSEEANRWVSVQSSKCGTNNSCGAFSICNPQDLDACQCLKGFEPFDADSGNRSDGCVRRKDLSCTNTSSDDNSNSNSSDRFMQFIKVELPSIQVKRRMDTAKRCESTCISNCTCVAYAYDFNGNCMLWHDQVLSLKNISTDIASANNNNNNNPSFFLRLAASELITTGKMRAGTSFTFIFLALFHFVSFF